MTRIYVVDTKGFLHRIINREIVWHNRKKCVKYNNRYHHITHPVGTGKNLWQIIIPYKKRR